MATLHFESIDQMPPGMRRLVENQLTNKVIAQKENRISVTADESQKRKYHNLPTERMLKNGQVIKFRSKKEALFFDGLMLKASQGTVRNVRMEVQFLLKPAYTDAVTGERYRAINYLADFVYEEIGEDGRFKMHIVDTKGGRKKGTRTKDYAIKRKLMADKGYYVEEC